MQVFSRKKKWEESFYHDKAKANATALSWAFKAIAMMITIKKKQEWDRE